MPIDPTQALFLAMRGSSPYPQFGFGGFSGPTLHEGGPYTHGPGGGTTESGYPVPPRQPTPWIHSQATPFLKQLGLTPDIADLIIRQARRGNLEIDPRRGIHSRNQFGQAPGGGYVNNPNDPNYFYNLGATPQQQNVLMRALQALQGMSFGGALRRGLAQMRTR
jgi:hypothetical protein